MKINELTNSRFRLFPTFPKGLVLRLQRKRQIEEGWREEPSSSEWSSPFTMELCINHNKESQPSIGVIFSSNTFGNRFSAWLQMVDCPVG